MNKIKINKKENKTFKYNQSNELVKFACGDLKDVFFGYCCNYLEVKDLCNFRSACKAVALKKKFGEFGRYIEERKIIYTENVLNQDFLDLIEKTVECYKKGAFFNNRIEEIRNLYSTNNCNLNFILNYEDGIYVVDIMNFILSLLSEASMQYVIDFSVINILRIISDIQKANVRSQFLKSLFKINEEAIYQKNQGFLLLKSLTMNVLVGLKKKELKLVQKIIEERVHSSQYYDLINSDSDSCILTEYGEIFKKLGLKQEFDSFEDFSYGQDYGCSKVDETKGRGKCVIS